ncbi:MAG: D-aminoacylase [Rhodospirillaceae bacterium]|jgi:N-acyl-D-aspartate/D-glutamate deacylase|nr:D-aminoacylase [Rhodospirillaceae bacterium]MBT3495508.1 D-aminoacylase [Rhodospirillaceae bacterium]MBT3780062.1 D-aminoacylase [Rhodospirillaceae bacterium]MBT3975449.1 D-aminoacylase [Rhodospirillaceae bacterium]MBT4171174.1 D-aminoacylase [Rhodospirillaceae bacterium]
MYDLKISNGTIIDGTGAPAIQGDLGIKDGKVVAMGEAPDAATREIDAQGQVVCPGFVDIHTHYDAQVLWDRNLTVSPWHGVTTAVIGNCGFGVAPTKAADRELIMRTLEKVEGMSVDALKAGLGEEWPFETFPEYLDTIDAVGPSINVGVLMGHTPLRLYVMGEAAMERAATPEELARMCELLEQGIKAGALGFATSKASTHVGYEGRPVPSRAAAMDEMHALCDVLGDLDKGVIQVTVGREMFLDEFEQIAERTGRPITWTALLAGLSLGKGGHEEQLVQSEKLAARGLQITPQVTPRPLNFEYQFKAPFPFEAISMFKPVSAADFDGKCRLYKDPEFRAAFKERMKNIRTSFQSSFSLTVISQYLPEPELAERRLFEVAAERDMDAIDLALDLALSSDLEARFRMPVANHDEDEVEPLLKSACTVLGLSDAGAHASQLCDACLPTYFLGRWVREKQAFTLEEAIRMLTSRTADVMGLTDRGRLALGKPADVVVFDPDTVGDQPLQRVYDFPAGADRLISEARGISNVIVNGTVIREHGADAVPDGAPLPGQLLRGGAAA